MTNAKMVYRTMSGVELRYEPVSPIVLELANEGVKKKYLERGEPVDTPTYTAETAGGGSQTFPHDETTLTTEEEKTAWAAHLDAVRRLQDEQDLLRTQIVLECIQGVELPADNAWAERQTARGITVPDDPTQRYIHYLKTEVLRSSADFRSITDAIMRAGYLGEASEEVIEASSKLFQDRLQKVAREALNASPIPEKSDESE